MKIWELDKTKAYEESSPQKVIFSWSPEKHDWVFEKTQLKNMPWTWANIEALNFKEVGGGNPEMWPFY